MTRFAFLSLLFLLFAGCRTAAHNPQKTILVHNQNTAKQFWNRTAQLFQPLMPDTEKRSVETESQWATHRFPSDIFPVNYTSQSLYRPSSVFLSPGLALQKPEEDFLTVETMAVAVAVNPLQIQAGDSEAFQRLLREIAVVPADKWNADEAKVTEWLTSFRNDVNDGIVDSDFEEEYLALLRKKILPEITTPKTAPLPEREFAETQHPVRSPAKQRPIEWAKEDDYDDEPIIAQSMMARRQPDYPSLSQLPNASPGVAQMSYQSQVHNPAMSGYGAGDWQTPARQAVEQLRYAIEQTPNGRSVSNEMRLRLLETILGNKTEAARPMQSADETINSFMTNQALGFAALLDDTAPDSRSKHVAAAFRFNSGLTDLQNLCPISLKNVTFIRECFGYGQFIPHPGEFHPGDRFHVYVETENLAVQRREMYETCMSISYEIRDDRANLIAKQEDRPPAGENSLTRKRDYFTIVPGVIPASTPPGEYQLLINITDLNDKSMQFAVERLTFKVVPVLDGELEPPANPPRASRPGGNLNDLPQTSPARLPL